MVTESGREDAAVGAADAGPATDPGAGPGTGSAASPVRRLLERPHGFDFFQAVRLLERAHVSGQRSGGAARMLGADDAPETEPVRFKTLPSLEFPGCAVHHVAAERSATELKRTRRPPEMVVSFMGLTGPSGVLPRHYTTMLAQRVRDKDYSLRDFLDLFNHRLISLFYRAWEKYRLPASHERTRRDARTTGEKDDKPTATLLSLVGMTPRPMRKRMEAPDEAILYFAGAFAHKPRCAVSLSRLLAEYFALKVEIRQFQGQWLDLDLGQRSAMPSRKMPRGLNNQLGRTVVLGDRVWDVQGKFRVRLGPLTYGEFCRFIPGGDALRSICQLVRLYAGPEFDFDIQPVLKKTEVRGAKLGDRSSPARLGYNVFAASKTPEHDFDGAAFYVN